MRLRILGEVSHCDELPVALDIRKADGLLVEDVQESCRATAMLDVRLARGVCRAGKYAGLRGDERGKKTASVRVKPRLTVTSNEAAIVAAVQGFGVTRLLSYQIAAFLASGQLKALLSNPPRALTSSRQISSATNPDFPPLLNGPVCAIDRPILIGGCAWAPSGKKPPNASAAATPKAPSLDIRLRLETACMTAPRSSYGCGGRSCAGDYLRASAQSGACGEREYQSPPESSIHHEPTR
jgi:hypothetical protein